MGKDLISRAEAIRIAEQGQVQGFEWQFKKLCELPSVQPRKGKWIEHDWAERVGEILISNYECDQCHEWEREKSDFCPNCGADMRSEAREYLEYGKLIAEGIAQGLRGDSDDD